jgi:hypothetical protein
MAGIGRRSASAVAMRRVVPGGPEIQWVLENPLAAEDQAILFPDGWIALARLEPYRVDWIAPDGSPVVGAPMPVAAVRVNDALKRAVIARRYPKVEPPFTADEFPPWPATFPAFANDALLAAPDGRLVIRRMVNPLTSVAVYDFVDRVGKLANQLELPIRERLVGFGARSLYVVATDDDDVEHLRRHPWP